MSHDILIAGETLIDFLPEEPGPIETGDRETYQHRSRSAIRFKVNGF